LIGSLFVTGPAGTGKSTFCASLKNFIQLNDAECYIVNLDPGADFVPYEADVDVREWISLSEIMQDYSLGPNGAQIVASDMILERTDEITRAVNELGEGYVVFDTPGQIELFSFRQGSMRLVDDLTGGRTMMSFLADSVIASTPSGFVSQKMLFGSVFYRFFKPMLFVLNKSDLVGSEDLARARRWEEDPDLLYDDLRDEKQAMVKEYLLGVVRSFRDSELTSRLYTTSSNGMSGFEDIYSQMNLFFLGGEESDTAYKDD
jgi:GTPase SAR1 family protein